eukprot:4869-Prymnesium_polylepis.1
MNSRDSGDSGDSDNFGEFARFGEPMQRWAHREEPSARCGVIVKPSARVRECTRGYGGVVGECDACV